MFFLEVDNVEKHSGGLKVLPGATLKVDKGEVRVLIGPNGSGKTTLFNVISGLLKPSKDKIVSIASKEENIIGQVAHLKFSF